MKTKAVILLSGGLDSTTLLYWAKDKGYDCTCLMFDYGQRHKKELNSAVKIAKTAGFPYEILKINFPWQTGSLTDKTKKLPVGADKNKKGEALPTTYVPGRNTVFISFAVSFAESIGASKILIGANAVDYSGYPDCRPGYYKAFNKVLSELATGLKIETPLIKLSKKDIVKLGTKLKVPHGLTWSCYSGAAKPCGVCDSCYYRAKGFFAAKVKDAGIK